MADSAMQPVKTYKEEELKTWNFTRLRYLATKYGLDPTKTFNQNELIAYVVAQQKKTGGKIKVNAAPATTAKKAAETSGDDDGEPESDEAATPPPSKGAKAATKAAAPASKPAGKAPGKKTTPPPTDDNDEPPPSAEVEEEPGYGDIDEEPAAAAEEAPEDDVPEAVEEPEAETEAPDEGTQTSETAEGFDTSELVELIKAVGHTQDEVLEKLAGLDDLIAKVDNLREKVFIQTGLTRLGLIKQGMGKADVDKYIANFKEAWKKQTA